MRDRPQTRKVGVVIVSGRPPSHGRRSPGTRRAAGPPFHVPLPSGIEERGSPGPGLGAYGFVVPLLHAARPAALGGDARSRIATSVARSRHAARSGVPRGTLWSVAVETQRYPVLRAAGEGSTWNALRRSASGGFFYLVLRLRGPRRLPRTLRQPPSGPTGSSDNLSSSGAPQMVPRGTQTDQADVTTQGTYEPAPRTSNPLSSPPIPGAGFRRSRPLAAARSTR